VRLQDSELISSIDELESRDTGRQEKKPGHASLSYLECVALECTAVENYSSDANVLMNSPMAIESCMVLVFVSCICLRA
jgi:hypothetical protein